MPSPGPAVPGRGGIDGLSDMPLKAFTGRASGFCREK